MTRRSPRSTPSPATIAATAALRASWRVSCSGASASLARFWAKSGYERETRARMSLRLDRPRRLRETVRQGRRVSMWRSRQRRSGQSSSGLLMDALRTLFRAAPGAAGVSLAAAISRFTHKCLWDQLALALFALALLLVVLTFRAYGVTWDEDCQNWYGNLVLTHYLWLIGAAPAPHWELLFQYADMYNYGAVFDLTAAVVNRFSPLGVFETRHLLNALVGIAGLVGCWKPGRRLGGPRGGLVAGLLLVLIPHYYGQMFNNPKDIPFAVGCIWATYYLIRLIPVLPRPPWRLVIKLGLATGL